MTVEDIYQDLMKRLAQARTLLLSEECDPMQAYDMYGQARVDYIRFEHILKDCAGHEALMQSFENTMDLLQQAAEEKGNL